MKSNYTLTMWSAKKHINHGNKDGRKTNTPSCCPSRCDKYENNLKFVTIISLTQFLSPPCLFSLLRISKALREMSNGENRERAVIVCFVRRHQTVINKMIEFFFLNRSKQLKFLLLIQSGIWKITSNVQAKVILFIISIS